MSSWGIENAVDSKTSRTNFLLLLTSCLGNPCFLPFMKSQCEWAQKKSFTLLKLKLNSVWCDPIASRSCWFTSHENSTHPTSLSIHDVTEPGAVFSLNTYHCSVSNVLLYEECVTYRSTKAISLKGAPTTRSIDKKNQKKKQNTKFSHMAS